MGTQSNMERRNSPRYRVRDGIFAHVASGMKALGRVLDVSEGGLSIEYLADEETPQDEGVLLSLFGRGGRFYLENVPLKTVSDYEIPREYDFSVVTVRRMGMAFGEMEPDQKKQLYGFILENSLN